MEKRQEGFRLRVVDRDCDFFIPHPSSLILYFSSFKICPKGSKDRVVGPCPDPHNAGMYRDIFQHLRKKKFRLLTRWKQRLEESFPLETTDLPRPPPLLLFRTFDECLRLLRQEPPENDPGSNPFTNLAWTDKDEREAMPDERWWTIYLIGEEVVADYVMNESKLREKYPPPELLAFLNHLFHTWHTLMLRQLTFTAGETGEAMDVPVAAAN